MSMLKDLKTRMDEDLHAIRVTRAVGKQDTEERPKKTIEDRRMENLQRKKERRANSTVSLARLTYDQVNDEYVYEVNTKVRRSELPHGYVHITGKKNQYLWTDLWYDLKWPGTGQSAIHMYLWVINEKINPDTISDKKRGTDLDVRKLLMYGGLAVVILIVSMQFMK